MVGIKGKRKKEDQFYVCFAHLATRGATFKAAIFLPTVISLSFAHKYTFFAPVQGAQYSDPLYSSLALAPLDCTGWGLQTVTP